MKKLLKVALYGISVLALASCTLKAKEPLPLPPGHLQDGNGLPPTAVMDHLAARIVNDLVRHHKDYIFSKMMLVATPVTVSEFNQSSDFGRQLQQSLMTSLQQQKFNVVDINLAQSMRITPQGDFILSRDWQQLRDDALVEYVLVTTYSFNQSGMQVNSKIVNLAYQQLMSAAAAHASLAEFGAYLEPSRTSVSESGIIYRYSKPGEGKVKLMGGSNE
ncbi:MAG: FlgO family outer membrane protein [Shewanella sp.]